MQKLISKDDIILVTGGSGFLGGHVVSQLASSGYNVVSVGNSKRPKKTTEKNILRVNIDLMDICEISRALANIQPSVVVHLAAAVGGIGANQKNPALFMYKNLQMGLNTIQASHAFNCKKFLMCGTVCSYPKFTTVPFREEDLWDGYPEETNAPYGIAKKTLMEMCLGYNEQYKFNCVNLIPVNLYGPCDNFDLNTSHVIPALIRKIDEANKAKEKEVVIWGTGKASREFLYVEDCARAIKLALELCDTPQPINVGTGSEITIKQLAIKIADLLAFKGKLVFDASKPDGQPRRCLETSKALKHFQFKAKTSLEKGLIYTIAWYLGKMYGE